VTTTSTANLLVGLPGLTEMQGTGPRLLPTTGVVALSTVLAIASP
jgi:hypothetical protein